MQPNIKSDMPQQNRSFLVQWASSIVNHRYFANSIIAIILINAVIVGLETYPNIYGSYTQWFTVLDRIILWIFTIEIILKLIAIRPTRQFFKDNWNIFDLLIVVGGHVLVGSQFITVLRILRVLRVLRTISVIPSLKRLVNALLLTIPSLGNIMVLMSIIFYIFAVIGTTLFRDIAPEYFGTLGASLITLFQVVTLESWASGVMRPILAEATWAWAYFVAFILVGTFVIFNLFVGVIVNNVEKANELEKEEEKLFSNPIIEEKEAQINNDAEIAELRADIKELKQLVLDLKASNETKK